jgi:hypothetical protein
METNNGQAAKIHPDLAWSHTGFYHYVVSLYRHGTNFHTTSARGVQRRLVA